MSCPNPKLQQVNDVGDMLNTFVLVDLDKIFSCSETAHVNHVRAFLQWFLPSWPTPENRKQVHWFLGFSWIAAPLHRLPSSRCSFHGPLRVHLLPLEILLLEFILEDDASVSGVGAILSQKSDTNLKIYLCAFCYLVFFLVFRFWTEFFTISLLDGVLHTGAHHFVFKDYNSQCPSFPVSFLNSPLSTNNSCHNKLLKESSWDNGWMDIDKIPLVLH